MLWKRLIPGAAFCAALLVAASVAAAPAALTQRTAVLTALPAPVAAPSGCVGPNPCLLLAETTPTSSGSGATVTTVSGTSQGCPSGSYVEVAEHVETNSTTGNFTDSGGNTYTGGNLVIVSGRLVIQRFKLTSALNAGANFTMAFSGATNAEVVAMCIPSAGAFQETGNAGASATSASPSLSTTSGLSTFPQWVSFALFSNGQLNNAATPSGYAKIGQVNVSGFGVAFYWKKTIASGNETFAPAGMSSAAWGLQVLTGT